jgi:hypothetical protein
MRGKPFSVSGRTNVVKRIIMIGKGHWQCNPAEIKPISFSGEFFIFLLGGGQSAIFTLL